MLFPEVRGFGQLAKDAKPNWPCEIVDTASKTDTLRPNSMFPRVAAFAVLATATALGVFGAGQPVCKLAWDPSPDPAVTEVVLYYGTKSRSYYSSNTYPVGVTNAAVSNLTVGVVYYFAVTARNRYGVESEYSNELGAPWEMIHETIGDGNLHSWEVSPPWMFFRVATGQEEGEQKSGGENW